MNEQQLKIEAIKNYLLTYCEPKPEYSGVLAEFMAVQILLAVQQVEIDQEERRYEIAKANAD